MWGFDQISILDMCGLMAYRNGSYLMEIIKHGLEMFMYKHQLCIRMVRLVSNIHLDHDNGGLYLGGAVLEFEEWGLSMIPCVV